MIPNRSVPTDTILPHIRYRDLNEAIAWLTRVFGFTEHYRYGDPLSGAQMGTANAFLMLEQLAPRQSTPRQLGYGTQSLTLFIEDVEQHFERAKAAAATILEEPHETVYGEFQYAAQDLDGHHWLFSRHARDRSPADWGATIAHPASVAPQISPMLAVSDAEAAIQFYRAAFGATLLWRLGGSEHIVAGLSVHGAPFFLATESRPHGTCGPAAAGYTTVRIELFVDDPLSVQQQAVEAGATLRDPVQEHEHPTTGPHPIRRMLQGCVIDPSGHMWLIGKFLD